MVTPVPLAILGKTGQAKKSDSWITTTQMSFVSALHTKPGSKFPFHAFIPFSASFKWSIFRLEIKDLGWQIKQGMVYVIEMVHADGG